MVGNNRVRQTELSRSGALIAPRLCPVAILIIFGDSRIAVSIRYVDVAFGVPSYISWLAEQSVYCGKRRIDVLPRSGVLISPFLPASEGHDYSAHLVKLDNHVGAF